MWNEGRGAAAVALFKGPIELPAWLNRAGGAAGKRPPGVLSGLAPPRPILLHVELRGIVWTPTQCMHMQHLYTQTSI